MLWATLLGFVIVLAIARKWASRHEDDTLHLHTSDSAVIERQSSLAGLLNRIDWVGKSLTVVVVLYGFVLIARILYMGWLDSLRMQ